MSGADFDAIYEDPVEGGGGGNGNAGASSGSGSGGGGGGMGVTALSSIEAAPLYHPEPPALVPDPIVVRGAGNITV